MVEFLRYRMAMPLSGFRGVAEEPPGYRIEPVLASEIEALAVLDVEEYRDTPDWDLVPELQTVEGCIRFLNDLFSGKTIFGGAQGVFRSDLSFKIVADDGTLAGAVFSLFTYTAVFIIDFAIAPAYRGRKLGTAFLTYSLARYRDAGYRQAVLFVTAHNTVALRLYEKLGFRMESSFVEEVHVPDPQASH